MWTYIVAVLLPSCAIYIIYLSMKNGFLTFGIEGLKQIRDHKSKEWKTERAVVPISSGDVKFEIETDVKWCPKTDEIFYRTPEETNMFQKEWKEISQYSDLYKKLLANFRRKYQQPNRTNTQRTKWTTAP